MDPLTAATKIVGFILGSMISAVIQAFAGNVVACIIFLGCVTATILSYIGPQAVAVLVPKILAVLGALSFIVGLVNDVFDKNTIVG